MRTLFKQVFLNEYDVHFPYHDANGKIYTEVLTCYQTGLYNRVNTVPLFCKNIAVNDVVLIDKVRGKLYFSDLIESSGNSVVQLIVNNISDIEQIGKSFEVLGCHWRKSENLIGIDIPARISYEPIKQILLAGSRDKRWDFREACLGGV